MTRAVSRVPAIPASSRIRTARPDPKPRSSPSRSSARRVSVHAWADPGLLGELAHRAASRRGPQDAIAAGRVGLGQQAGGERLARPRQRLDRLHPVTARRQANDHAGLFRRRHERRARYHAIHQRAIEDAGAFATARLRALHDRLLVGEQIARRESLLSETGRTVHVRTGEELRGGALDRPRRCALTVRGRPRHHRLALGERVLALGQPARSDQLSAHPPRITDLWRPGRSEHQRGELALAKPVLGGPRAHDVTPRRGVDPVALATARVVRDRLTPRIPDLNPGRHELALALLDLATACRELPQHARCELLDLRHPVAHRAPPHPRQPFAHRGAQVRLIEEPGGLGVPVDRRGIKRRPPPVAATGHVRRHHMGMQLWILGATHPMAIRGRHQPLPRLVAHPAAAAAHPTRLALQIPQRRVDR